MRNRNGNGIGFRNLPTISEASGVWDVEDAYLADRDGVWPRWPRDAGIPILPGLALWLEVDYGLYQDRAATIPAVADGDPVRAWVNRGYAGVVRVDNDAMPMVLRISGDHRWLETEGAITEPVFFTGKQFNYVFGLGYETSTTSFLEVISPCSPSTGLYTTLSPSFSAAQSNVLLPRSDSLVQSLSRSSTGTKFFGQGFVDFAYSSENSAHFGGTNAARVMRLTSVGFEGISGGTTNAPAVQSAPYAVRLFGRKSETGLIDGAMGKAKALLLYSSDISLSPAQLETISRFLATKYDAYSYIAAKWGN